MGVLNISNIINVNLTNVPTGLQVPNVNSLALFTNEIPSNIDSYRIYLSPGEVASDYGTNSVTALMANNIFSQNPGLLSGNGRLIVIPMPTTVGATTGSFTTADISANLAALKVVTDGDLKVTLNGSVINLVGINFAGSETLADIAKVLQSKLLDIKIEAVGTTEIKFTSKKVGLISAVTLGSVTGGTGTDISGALYLNQSAGTAVSGVNSSGETLLNAIARTEQNVQYVGVITSFNLEDAAISAIAAGIQSKDMIFLHHFASSTDIASIITDISTAKQTHTRALFYRDDINNANLMKAAYAGRAFSVDFSGSATAQTMQLKDLVNVLPDLNINQTLFTNAKTAGADMYVSFGGVASVESTGGNDYFDNIYNDIWLKFAFQVAGFNYLKQTNTKTPQTETGMNGLKAAFANVCEQAVRNGVIGQGLQWNSPETFGNPDDLRRNITDKGYYIYSLPIAQQSQVDRNQRKAPLVQVAVKYAGAIHSAIVNVLIER